MGRWAGYDVWGAAVAPKGDVWGYVWGDVWGAWFHVWGDVWGDVWGAYGARMGRVWGAWFHVRPACDTRRLTCVRPR